MIKTTYYQDLTKMNTFGMRVKARCFIEYDSVADLVDIEFSELARPVLHIGGGSNLLFTDDFKGTVLHSKINFIEILEDAPSSADEVLVSVGAGVVFDDFCAWAAKEGLWGVENLSYIPGEVGASAVQNIGAYGVEVKDVIRTVYCYDTVEEEFVSFPVEDCGYGYRDSFFKKAEVKGRYVVTHVVFALSRGGKAVLDYGHLREAVSEAAGNSDDPRPRELGHPLAGGGMSQNFPTASDTTTTVTPGVGKCLLHTDGTSPSTAAVTCESASDATCAVTQEVASDATCAVTKEVASDTTTAVTKGGATDTTCAVTPGVIRKVIIGIRREKLPEPSVMGSAGSFFKNPVISQAHFKQIEAEAKAEKGPDYKVPHYDLPEGTIKVPAAWMIEQCGWKGRRSGGAAVYEKQPLVIVNYTGEAYPEEIIGLERRIVDSVKQKFGVELHPEVEHI